MGKQFGKSIAWLTGFVFLGLMVFAGPGFANESGQKEGDSAQRTDEYSAEGYCGYGGLLADYEKISSVTWETAYAPSEDRISVTADVSITVTDRTEGTEYLTLWADRNGNGAFEKGTDPGQIREEVMTVPLSVSSMGDGESVSLSAEIPGEYAATEIQMKISLAYECRPDVCETCVWGDVWDERVTVPGITLSNAGVDENMPQLTPIGTFSVIGEDSNETYDYSLVPKEEYPDNEHFFIANDILLFKSESLEYGFDFETKSSYSIRVQASDKNNVRIFEKTFTITVNDNDEYIISGCITEDTVGICKEWENACSSDDDIKFNLTFEYHNKSYDGGEWSVNPPIDDKGCYEHIVNKGWSGTVTIERYGYQFDPLERSYEEVNSNLEEHDFLAKRPPIIRGVVYGNGGGTPGTERTEVFFSNDSGFFESAMTDTSGRFHKKVRRGWSGRVTPSKGAHTFFHSDSFRPDCALKNVDSDRFLTFWAKKPNTKTGLVLKSMTNNTYQPFEGVTVDFSDDGGSAVTGTSGAYFLPVAEDWTGTITPRMVGYSFKTLDFPFLNTPIFIATGPRTSGVYLDIYADDNYHAAPRPRISKFPGDLTDIVVRISNDAIVTQENITLMLTIPDAGAVVPASLSPPHIYLRSSPTGNPGFEITASFYEDIEENGKRILTIEPLELPADLTGMDFSEFVFRFRLSGRKHGYVDAVATVSGDNLEASSVKLSDAIWLPVVVTPGPKAIFLSNRELMYRTFESESPQFDELWEAVYSIAEERHAVIYHADKYDRTDGGDRNITTEWYEERRTLADGAGGTYGYDPSPDSDHEEIIINQAAFRVRELLGEFIEKSGGIASGRHVAILGGDSAIPFYRVFDPTKWETDDCEGGTVSCHSGQYNATDVTVTDAKNNYFFTDMFYRDHDGSEDWKEGKVENIFVGRVTGTSPENMRQLLISSNNTESASANVVELEMNVMNCCMKVYGQLSEMAGFDVIDEIEGVSLDPPFSDPHDPASEICFKPGEDLISSAGDPARWDNDFYHLFTGMIGDTYNFDVMRLMCHGTVEAVKGTDHRDVFFRGVNLKNNAYHIRNYFSSFSPFFMFDSCLVGLADGKDTKDLLNALLPLNVRGVVANSTMAYSPQIVKLSDMFYCYFLKGGFSAGAALCEADREKWKGKDDDMYLYTKLGLNLFGLPWANITPPKTSDFECSLLDGEKNCKPLESGSGAKKSSQNSLRERITQSDVNTYTISETFDASDYHIESMNEFDIVEIEGFGLTDYSYEPEIPFLNFDFNIPKDATVENFSVVFSNPTDLGELNIPATKPCPMIVTHCEYYIPCPDDLGVYPPEQYVGEVGDYHYRYKDVFGITYPLVHDTLTKQTTLYETVDIEVTYTSQSKGIFHWGGIWGNKSDYGVYENIETYAYVENTSAEAHDFQITVEVRDDFWFMGDNLYSSETVTQTVESGAAEYVTVNVKAPDIYGDYKVVMTVSDGNGVLGEDEESFDVITGQIVSLSSPDVFYTGIPGEFTAEIQNAYDSDLLAVMSLGIHHPETDYINPVISLPWVAEIAAGETKEIRIPWTPPVSLAPGSYQMRLTATMNGETLTTLDHPEFGIVPTLPGYAAQILKVLAGESGYVWSDVDGDGKAEMADVIRILQAVSETGGAR